MTFPADPTDLQAPPGLSDTSGGFDDGSSSGGLSGTSPGGVPWLINITTGGPVTSAGKDGSLWAADESGQWYQVRGSTATAPTAATQRPLVVGPKSMIYDPATQRFVPRPDGGAGTTTTAGAGTGTAANPLGVPTSYHPNTVVPAGSSIADSSGHITGTAPAASDPKQFALLAQQAQQNYQLAMMEAQRKYQADRDIQNFHQATLQAQTQYQNELLQIQRVTLEQQAALSDRQMAQPQWHDLGDGRSTMIMPSGFAGSAFNGQYGIPGSDWSVLDRPDMQTPQIAQSGQQEVPPLQPTATPPTADPALLALPTTSSPTNLAPATRPQGANSFTGGNGSVNTGRSGSDAQNPAAAAAAPATDRSYDTWPTGDPSTLSSQVTSSDRSFDTWPTGDPSSLSGAAPDMTPSGNMPAIPEIPQIPSLLQPSADGNLAGTGSTPDYQPSWLTPTPQQPQTNDASSTPPWMPQPSAQPQQQPSGIQWPDIGGILGGAGEAIGQGISNLGRSDANALGLTTGVAGGSGADPNTNRPGFHQNPFTGRWDPDLDAGGMPGGGGADFDESQQLWTGSGGDEGGEPHDGRHPLERMPDPWDNTTRLYGYAPGIENYMRPSAAKEAYDQEHDRRMNDDSQPWPNWNNMHGPRTPQPPPAHEYVPPPQDDTQPPTRQYPDDIPNFVPPDAGTDFDDDVRYHPRDFSRGSTGSGAGELPQDLGAIGAGPGLGQPMQTPAGGLQSPIDQAQLVGQGHQFGEDTGDETPYHKGVDFQAYEGTPVGSTVDGVVVEAGDRGDLGLSVVVQDSAGQMQEFNHLSSIEVNIGDSVSKGDCLGQVGTTGNSSGPHLDYRVRGQNGDFTDPMSQPAIAGALAGQQDMGMPHAGGGDWRELVGSGANEGGGWYDDGNATDSGDGGNTSWQSPVTNNPNVFGSGTGAVNSSNSSYGSTAAPSTTQFTDPSGTQTSPWHPDQPSSNNNNNSSSSSSGPPPLLSDNSGYGSGPYGFGPTELDYGPNAGAGFTGADSTGPNPSNPAAPGTPQTTLRNTGNYVPHGFHVHTDGNYDYYVDDNGVFLGFTPHFDPAQINAQEAASEKLQGGTSLQLQSARLDAQYQQMLLTASSAKERLQLQIDYQKTKDQLGQQMALEAEASNERIAGTNARAGVLSTWGRAAAASPWLARMSGRTPTPGDLGSGNGLGQQSASSAQLLTGTGSQPGTWQGMMAPGDGQAWNGSGLGYGGGGDNPEMGDAGAGNASWVGRGGDFDDFDDGNAPDSNQQDPMVASAPQASQQSSPSFGGLATPDASNTGTSSSSPFSSGGFDLSGFGNSLADLGGDAPSHPTADQWDALGPFGHSALRFTLESAGYNWPSYAESMLGDWRAGSEQAPSGLNGWQAPMTTPLGWEASNPYQRENMQQDAELFGPFSDYQERQQRAWQPMTRSTIHA